MTKEQALAQAEQLNKHLPVSHILFEVHEAKDPEPQMDCDPEYVLVGRDVDGLAYAEFQVIAVGPDDIDATKVSG